MTNENQKEVAQEESPFISHAKLEFKALGWADEKGFIKDDMQALICENILQLLRVFSSQGHSGTTAPYAVDVFRKLAMFKPLGPLTGEDWEWQDVSHNYDGKPVFQNKRYSQVFKHGENGKAEDIRGRVFREPDKRRNNKRS